jgi:hypothetical protein
MKPGRWRQAFVARPRESRSVSRRMSVSAKAEPAPLQAPARRPWHALRVPLALLLLNVSLAFDLWWPTPMIELDHRISPEAVILWAALLGWTVWRGVPSQRALGVLAFGYSCFVLGRYLDIAAPALFGRPINLYWDVPQIPRFLWVTAQETAWWISVTVVAVVVLLLWSLWRLVRWALRTVAQVAVPYALHQRWTWAVTAGLLVAVALNYGGVQATWPFISRPVLPTYVKQAQLLAAAASPEALARLLPARTVVDEASALPPGIALGGLNGRDVYLIFLESIGAVTYDNPKAASHLAPIRAELDAAIRSSGRHVVSAMMSSPTFGGASDLAHMGLLSGVDLSDPRRHDLLLTTGRPTLLSLFRSQGYETFGLYHAVSWEWPERAFYGYDHYIDGPALGYEGPRLGYWSIPDQFALARYEQMHPRGEQRPPRLLFLATITCHLPFSPVPPYQPDWQRVLSPTPFDAQETARALAEQPNWLDMFPDYLRMAEYTYRWIAGFMREPEQRDTVFILLGDHQPAANVSGPGAPWHVPVHVVARDPDLLARFQAQGFTAGLAPAREPLGGMHDLTGILLRAFAAPGDATGGEGKAGPGATAPTLPATQRAFVSRPHS